MILSCVVQKVAQTNVIAWVVDPNDATNTKDSGLKVQEVTLKVLDGPRLGTSDNGSATLIFGRTEHIGMFKPGDVVKVELTREG